MSEEQAPEMVTIQSSRFGDMTVPAETLIVFPNGLIGFPRHRKYVMFDHKPPFAWLHSAEDPNLAFVVIDGYEIVKRYELSPPLNDRDIELQEEDEYATLVIVTVRPDPRMTTANIKAPLFVNLRNRRGIQMIFDDAKLPTRLSLWSETQGEGAKAEAADQKPESDAPKKD